jgi:hypothetical protein
MLQAIALASSHRLAAALVAAISRLKERREEGKKGSRIEKELDVLPPEHEAPPQSATMM